MSWTALVIWQILLDVVLCGAVTVLLLQRRGPLRRAAAPPQPAWYPELVELVQDVIVAADRMVESREPQRPVPADEAPSQAERSEPRQDPWTMVRTGLAPEEAARRGGLGLAELQLLRNVAAAAAEPPSA